jgi:hypothetical protein
LRWLGDAASGSTWVSAREVDSGNIPGADSTASPRLDFGKFTFITATIASLTLRVGNPQHSPSQHRHAVVVVGIVPPLGIRTDMVRLFPRSKRVTLVHFGAY